MTFKKTILSVGTIAASAIPIATVISCGVDLGDNYKVSGGDIYLITDAGSVKDKSFNEFTFKGIQDFSNGAGNGKKYSFIQPQSVDRELFQKSYEVAISHGAQTIVLPGFHHEYDGEAATIAAKHKDIAFIGVDTHIKGTNVMNLNYKTEQSAFLAAVYTGVYMNQNHLIIGDKLKVSAFGGAKIPPVVRYLNGWLQGIRYFNDRAAAKGYIPMESTYVGGKIWNNFSGSFDAGDASVLSRSLINDGVQVTFAVAGGQTADFIGAAKELKNHKYVFAIGADTDQSLQYDKDYMLGSALKGVDTSTTMALNDLYSSDTSLQFGTRQGSGIGSKEIIFKENNREFGAPAVDFVESASISDAINTAVTTGSIYTDAKIYSSGDKIKIDKYDSSKYPVGTLEGGYWHVKDQN